MIRPSRAPRRTHTRAGFTLTELMVVVVIVALSAALALPSLRTAMAERRLSQASLDLVRLSRRARAEALGYGRAHLLRYTQASGTASHGRVRLFRGLSSSCRAQPAGGWTALVAGPACLAAGSMCVDDLDLDRYAVGPHTVDLRPIGIAATTLDICYTPTGTMYWRTSAGGVFTDRNTVNGGVQFSLTRKVGGAAAGVARQVIFPIGGTPRIFR